MAFNKSAPSAALASGVFASVLLAAACSSRQSLPPAPVIQTQAPASPAYVPGAERAQAAFVIADQSVPFNAADWVACSFTLAPDGTSRLDVSFYNRGSLAQLQLSLAGFDPSRRTHLLTSVADGAATFAFDNRRDYTFVSIHPAAPELASFSTACETRYSLSGGLLQGQIKCANAWSEKPSGDAGHPTVTDVSASFTCPLSDRRYLNVQPNSAWAGS